MIVFRMPDDMEKKPVHRFSDGGAGKAERKQVPAAYGQAGEGKTQPAVQNGKQGFKSGIVAEGRGHGGGGATGRNPVAGQGEPPSDGVRGKAGVQNGTGRGAGTCNFSVQTQPREKCRKTGYRARLYEQAAESGPAEQGFVRKAAQPGIVPGRKRGGVQPGREKAVG